jgi:serine/threonine-protein kinase
MSVPTETRCNVCGRPATPADRYCGFCGSRLDGDNATPTAESTGPHRPHVDRILSALRAATIGEYDIAGEIGRGGMAVVFLAHDLSLNRKVAIKVLLPELLYTEGMDRRFKHEARIAAKLDHPNILVIHGVREANDLLFIVMKLVDGLPLSAIAKVAGPLPVPVVRGIVRNVADALSYAHGEGVVHRDVKPANIMVDRRGNVVVMDFGIAKAADDAHLTRTGLVIGTPAYMSPEQCLAHGVTPASDQYSLGVVAYELLTGKTPFRGSALEMQWAHATAAPPPVRSLRPDCPADLEAVVLRMMAKSPDDRWPTLHDVSHALADDPATVSAARSALIALVSEVPGRRDTTMPTTPASPVPIGPGPAVVGDATTDPVRGTGGPSDAAAPVTTTPDGGAAASPMLTLSQQRIELSTGDAVELVVELDSDDQRTDGSEVEWQTSDPAVATVSRDGLVTAVGPGLAEVTCIWRGRRAVCLVQVSAASAAAQPSPPERRDPSMATAGSVIALGAPAAKAPAAPVPVRSPRCYWWIGVLAAGVAGVALFRAFRPDAFVTALPKDVATSPATPAAPTPPPSAPATGRPSTSTVTSAPVSPAPIAGAGAARSPAPAGGSREGAGVRQAIASPPSSVPPAVPRARLDSARLTTRVDTTGYGAARSGATPTTSTPAPAAPATRDSAADVIPVAPREIASALFKEFANAINGRSYSRITSAFPQPSDPTAAKVWADFLVFVRDYTPRATVRSSVVNETSTPPTITATIDFRWSSDAGFDRVRSGSFVGIGVPIPGGWQLRGVKLAKKFW